MDRWAGCRGADLVRRQPNCRADISKLPQLIAVCGRCGWRTAEAGYQIVSLLPRDAIPAIDNPRFVEGAEADEQYHEDEVVLGVAINDDVRAYSVPFLSGHEIVNDVVGGEPIAVTW
ncbi:MAG: DUF3179 domain-containing protein [Caldilineaceae bacterium]|nr:DUF3179 domain-containing protein [Caldilineaceae bacterium]